LGLGQEGAAVAPEPLPDHGPPGGPGVGRPGVLVAVLVLLLGPFLFLAVVLLVFVLLPVLLLLTLARRGDDADGVVEHLGQNFFQGLRQRGGAAVLAEGDDAVLAAPLAVAGPGAGKAGFAQGLDGLPDILDLVRRPLNDNGVAVGV